MTNFLLFLIALILACLTWGTGIVAGTVVGMAVLFILVIIFCKAWAHIASCLP